MAAGTELLILWVADPECLQVLPLCHQLILTFVESLVLCLHLRQR